MYKCLLYLGYSLYIGGIDPERDFCAYVWKFLSLILKFV